MHSRGMRRIGALTAATAILSAGLITSVSTANASARSFISAEVVLDNNTKCNLRLVTSRLDHGEWEREPSPFIAFGDESVWQSDSHGIGTGTEGEADYFTEGCLNGDDNQKRVHLHWNVPAAGGNSGDAAGTDGRFRARVNVGSGNHAGFLFVFRHI